MKLGKLIARNERGEKISVYVNSEHVDGIIIPKKTSAQVIAFVQLGAVNLQCTPIEANAFLGKFKDLTCHLDVPDGDIYINPARIRLVKIPSRLAEDDVAHVIVGPHLLDFKVPISEAEKALFFIDVESTTFMEKN